MDCTFRHVRLSHPWRFAQLLKAPKNVPSLAVALKRGIASSSFMAEVKAFERLHIVRDMNSSYCGLK
jgi:hypothetical protein